MHRSSAVWIVAIALGVSGTPSEGLARPAAKVHRVGYLGYGSAPSTAHLDDGDFQQALREAGYVVGKNVTIKYQYGRADELAAKAADLVRSPVDVIVTSGEPAAFAAKQATKAIPIVAIEFAVDPVKGGLVTSLGRPEGNLTGIAIDGAELWQKRLSVLRVIAPKIVRVAVLWNRANSGNESCVEEIKAAALAMGLQVNAFDVSDAKTLDSALTKIAKEPPDALALCWDSVTLTHTKAITDFALKLRLPTVAAVREYVQGGSAVDRDEPSSAAAAHRSLCQQDPQRRKAGGPSDRADGQP